VNRLIRVSYGPFQLGELAEGAVEEVPTRHLREQIGERIAATAGAEFSGPIEPLKPEPQDRPARTPRPPAEVDSRAQRGEGDRGWGGRVASGAAGKRRDDPHRGRFAHSRREASASSGSTATEGRLRPSRKGEGQDKDKPARKRRGSSHHVW